MKIPSNWIICNLGDIAYVNDVNHKMPKSVRSGVPFISPKDFIENGIDFSNVKYISKQDYEILSKKVKPQHNDILYSRIGTIGKVRLAPKKEFGISYSLAVIRTYSDSIFNKFILYALQSPSIYQQSQRQKRSIGVPDLGLTEIKTFKIPLAPLNEQKRIVRKIEELFSILDASRDTLLQIKKQLNHFHISLLKSGFNGDLTEDWRKTHSVSPISTLLKQIEQKIPQEPREILTRIPKLNNLELSRLPRTWAWVRLGDLTNMTSGKAFKKSEYVDEGIRLFQIANVSFGETLWENLIHLPKNYLKSHPQLELHSGDVVLALNRPILNNKLKITMLEHEDEPSILYQRVGRLDFYENEVKEFVYYYLQSHSFVDALAPLLQGVDQPFINKPKLMRIPIPLAPLEEQRTILGIIKSQLSGIRHNIQEVDNMLKSITIIKQSILQSSFEGKLVSQESGDEPAIILLEKIKQEKFKK